MEAIVTLLVFVLLTVPLALLVLALFDSSKYAEATWEAAGHIRANWMIIILLVVGIGPILYFTKVKPKLREIEPDAAAVDLDPGNERFG